ncbi:Hsp20/alpha crystallin family protein [Ruminococcus sp.]
MLMPSIFGENLFDDFFGDFPFYYDDRAMKDTEKKLYGRRASHIMKTDIKETDKGYELVVDLPGFTKDEVKADLENGYLTISAEKGLDKDEQEKETGRYIRKERYAGACSRSFYVGKEVEKEDIKAEFKHGILTLSSLSPLVRCSEREYFSRKDVSYSPFTKAGAYIIRRR